MNMLVTLFLHAIYIAIPLAPPTVMIIAAREENRLKISAKTESAIIVLMMLLSIAWTLFVHTLGSGDSFVASKNGIADASFVTSFIFAFALLYDR